MPLVQLICCFLAFSPGPGKVGSHSVKTTTSSIFLTWTSAPGLNLEYRVEWKSSENSMWLQKVNTSALLSDVTPGTNYTITITAVVGDNVTGEPHTFSAVTSNLNFL